MTARGPVGGSRARFLEPFDLDLLQQRDGIVIGLAQGRALDWSDCTLLARRLDFLIGEAEDVSKNFKGMLAEQR